MIKRLTYGNVCNTFYEFVESMHCDINEDYITWAKDNLLTSSLLYDTAMGEYELDIESVLIELFTDYLATRQITWDRGIVDMIIQTTLKNSHYDIKATILDAVKRVKQNHGGSKSYSESESEA
jgi:hypothetical protein